MKEQLIKRFELAVEDSEEVRFHFCFKENEINVTVVPDAVDRSGDKVIIYCSNNYYSFSANNVEYDELDEVVYCDGVVISFENGLYEDF